VTLNKIRDHARRAKGEVAGTGRSSVQEILEQQPASQDVEEFDREYFQRLLEWAAEKVRGRFKEKTFAAFWLTVVEQQPVDAVAERLGMPKAAVLLAKCRLLKRVRMLLETMGTN
jgi:hypothetical protein